MYSPLLFYMFPSILSNFAFMFFFVFINQIDCNERDGQIAINKAKLG